MNLITVDFETYYDRDFSLSKITTEEYIRSDLFEVIGVSVKVNNEETEWASGILNGSGGLSWRTTPFLTGLSCLGVSVLILGVGLTLCAWAVPFTAWKLGVRLKLWLSGTGSAQKEQKSSTPSVKDD
jgi:hypothetical protein